MKTILILFIIITLYSCNQKNSAIRIKANKESAIVYIDGKIKGNTPLDIKVAKGKYLIEVIKKIKGKSFENLYFKKEITISDNVAMKINASLVHKKLDTNEAKKIIKEKKDISSYVEFIRYYNDIKYIEKINSFHNNKDIDKIHINGGTFQMGSNDGSNEQPIHTVTLSSFRISKYEITNQQYADFMNAIGANADGSVAGVEYLDMGVSAIQISHNGSSFVVNSGKENYPVIEVSWYGAFAYCLYAGGRLPTEAEWEFVARGGNSSNGYTYSGSNTIDDVAWYNSNSGGATHIVGTKNANELGLHDMSGNVWEWTNDWYDSNYYSSSPSSNP